MMVFTHLVLGDGLGFDLPPAASRSDADPSELPGRSSSLSVSVCQRSCNTVPTLTSPDVCKM